MTSRGPYWFSKQILWELDSSYVKKFSCSHKFAQMLATWVNTFCRWWLSTRGDLITDNKRQTGGRHRFAQTWRVTSLLKEYVADYDVRKMSACRACRKTFLISRLFCLFSFDTRWRNKQRTSSSNLNLTFTTFNFKDATKTFRFLLWRIRFSRLKLH